MCVRTLAGALLLLSLLGCGKSFKNDADSATGQVKVQIIAPGSVSEAPLSAPPYAVKVVDLLDVYDLVSASGKYARFYTRASRTDALLNGTQPRGQYMKNKDGVFIPKNFLTQQIATLYYHSQNMIQLETSLDLDSKRTSPLKIVLDTPVLNTTQNENNAFYDGELDAIIYLKYSEGSLPLSLNGGVFAHEYFHSIFERVVLKAIRTNQIFTAPISINKLINKKTLEYAKNVDLSDQIEKLNEQLAAGPISLNSENVKWYYTLLVKGFNEGLADYWGWQYVNDSAFIAHSLPQTLMTRKLDLKTQNIDTLQLLSEAEMLSIVYQVSASNEEKLELVNAFSYLLGSRVALFFKSYSEKVQKERGLNDVEIKKLMNQAVINFVKIMARTLPEITMANDQTELVSTYTLMYDFISFQEIKTKNECDFLRAFLENDPKWNGKIQCVANTTSDGSHTSLFKITSKGER